MANFEAVTVSNGARVKDIEAVKRLLGLYEPNSDVTIGLTEEWLNIYGYDWPKIFKNDADDEECDEDFFEEFLQRLAPLLAEPLLIQCIGHEKCRFPLSAMQVLVKPTGEIKWMTFDSFHELL